MECRICDAQEIRSDEAYLARAIMFPNPLFQDHVAVATTEHKEELQVVSPAEWQAIGSLIAPLVTELSRKPEVQKVYVLLIGDVDRHIHLHLVPKRFPEKPLGPFIFGPQGWLMNRAVG